MSLLPGASTAGGIGLGLGAVGFIQGLLKGASGDRYALAAAVDSQGVPQTGASGQPQYKAFPAFVAFSEDHYDETHITDNPVAQGSVVSDHAINLPARLTAIMGWSPSTAANSGSLSLLGIAVPTLTGLWGGGTDPGAFLKGIYAQVLAAKRARSLITISTGKRLYTNMLIENVRETTTPETENVLTLTISFRELLFANTTIINSPINTAPGGQANPPATTPPQNLGSQNTQPYNQPVGAN